ncbi:MULTISPECIES: DUF934 domain-containing protein [unclassified Chelatococcus]|uniref:DUF934 domain-containing protein n=1 Tax=unclassified Chelatococcus TaxID=2638111 RepID=UPI001BCED696|nr:MULTISPECIES: DUF934 domain-containing protein [unclassified Chelatococcus]CAH1660497.1 Oxidoreductase probably involved in sulfite reduction [Hyphomicrobiales bacterium]MBS7741119.1 DUF934 domain-containing protein [Chelatococcus sp. HY11]MBX3545305.1 DUF934 domain-containing protein [Chelatococcus sp.]MCO5077938.1 DUF934 domain-containing protein [Chelatococcus sp.]CAH1683412.1 Oxidoreductase probably involved in sulfite reduction [Hyphomicrobiales bacterium]
MPLFKNGTFVDDPWQTLADDVAVPADRSVIVSKTRYLAERDALAGRNAPLGLLLQPGEGLEEIEADLPRFAVIALAFPKFNDGRSYSTARLLRERHGFAGELRAIGNILRDQVNSLHRCGFDALDVTHPGTIAALEKGAIKFVHRHYQPAAVDAVEAGPPADRPRLRVTPGQA